MSTKTEPGNVISILNVGTQILTKDLMDQYIRSLGDYLGHYRTHYGVNIATSKRVLEEHRVSIVITEFELNDGSAFELIEYIRNKNRHYTYFILAIPEENVSLQAIAQELEVDAILSKPFTAKDIKLQFEKYHKKEAEKTDEDFVLFEAQLAFREKKYLQSEKLY